jgi:hypothetical protein
MRTADQTSAIMSMILKPRGIASEDGHSAALCFSVVWTYVVAMIPPTTKASFTSNTPASIYVRVWSATAGSRCTPAARRIPRCTEQADQRGRRYRLKQTKRAQEDDEREAYDRCRAERVNCERERPTPRLFYPQSERRRFQPVEHDPILHRRDCCVFPSTRKARRPHTKYASGVCIPTHGEKYS